ncbi:response regulator [Parapedobacter sp. DT-150]|uniref:response regulator n=1 Tax=Parapedobacter sp. DT-150 TaxID=3396162 RepID=UPI003F1CF6B2
MEHRVLVIDDDDMFNLMAKVLLREAGITDRPTICTNGHEALALLRQQAPAGREILLFLDINMPSMSGWEVLEAIQELPHHRHIHVVIVTSSVDKADRAHALLYEQVIDYLIKPITREHLYALKTEGSLSSFFGRSRS